ncbi:MAG: glycosyltransferase [Planctomycetes bacterium]|nr:glycosyltransferase [Planctomycetota bacterium]
MRPIRVLHLIDSLGGGGSEEWVRETCRILGAGGGFRFEVAHLRRPRTPFSYESSLRALGVPVHYLGGVLLPARLAAFLATRRFDVLHVHLFASALLGIPLARLAGHRRIVCTVPCRWEQTRRDFPWVFPAYRLLAPWVDRFLTALPVEEIVRKSGVPRGRVVPFRGSIDIAQTEASCEQARRSPPPLSELAGGGPVVLGTARFHPDKRHDLAVEAAARLRTGFPNLRWVLLGDGPEREALQARARRLGLEGTVLFPGFRTDVASFCAHADLYVRTSSNEGVNRSQLTAMACALPMVGVRSGAPEGVEEGINGRLVAPDPDAIARAVASILSDPPCARAMGAESLRRARGEDVHHATDEFASLYRSLASEMLATQRRAGSAVAAENLLAHPPGEQEQHPVDGGDLLIAGDASRPGQRRAAVRAG